MSAAQKIKPRIHRLRPDTSPEFPYRWRCLGGGFQAYGPTPAVAFERWSTPGRRSYMSAETERLFVEDRREMAQAGEPAADRRQWTKLHPHTIPGVSGRMWSELAQRRRNLPGVDDTHPRSYELGRKK